MSGNPLKVAVVDSGINPTHSHVGRVAGGVSFLDPPSGVDPPWLDELGHGTAVAAAIRAHAPNIELFAVRVFGKSFATEIDRVVAGIEWCVQSRMDVVNVSLATLKEGHRAPLEEVCAGVQILVAPYDFLGVPAFPGSFPSAFGAAADRTLDRSRCRLEESPSPHFAASPFPRSLETLPDDLNFNGPSFATANVSGLICRILQEKAPASDALLRSLLAGSAKNPPA